MTTMYTPEEVRKLKAERDELLRAANGIFIRLLVGPYDTVEWPEMRDLAVAIDKAEGRSE